MKRKILLYVLIALLVMVLLQLFRTYRIAVGDWKCYEEGECIFGDFAEFEWHHAMLYSDTLYAQGRPIAIAVDYRYRLLSGDDLIEVRALNGTLTSRYVSK